MFQENPQDAQTTDVVETRSTSGREAVKIMLVGTPQGVVNIIHTLYRRGFAEVTEWSPPLPTTIPGEVMRVLVRHLVLD
ncbi:MAG TPA: hypothetical protein IGS31_04090 [Oscillatoriales cyanobacterium M4454_W2019_049]|nr:hypothetical protein [Oscillatoriales cyanobacterium M4454_W2019_049]